MYMRVCKANGRYILNEPEISRKIEREMERERMKQMDREISRKGEIQ